MAQFSYPKDLYTFQSKWVIVNGNRIHYIDEGKGETILFCHPPVSSSFMYRNMIATLSKNFRCIAIDFPGFGSSEAHPEYEQSITSQAIIIHGFLKELNLRNIFLLMQEVGGHAAMKVFIQQLHLLKGIIITDTITFPCSLYPKIVRMLNFVNGSIFNFLNSNFNFLPRAMTRFGIRKRKLSKVERDVYKKMFDTRDKRRAVTHLLHDLVVQEKLLSAIQQNLETTFNNLPVLLIYGDKDPLAGMGIPHRIHKMLPNSELHWIIGEAHFPHEGAPEEMSALITNWLKGILSTICIVGM